MWRMSRATALGGILGAVVSLAAGARLAERATARAAGGGERIEAGARVADLWLAELDQGRYVDGWDQASSLFKGDWPRARWQSFLDAARRPLGHTVSRRLARGQFATVLPGMTQGEYVLVQFETSFAFQQTALETVTLLLEADGQWRVAGYFVR